MLAVAAAVVVIGGCAAFAFGLIGSQAVSNARETIRPVTELSWSGAPAGTKSFAINMFDPDAPTGSGWWHWVVFNIPASTTSLPKDAGNLKKRKLMPKGAIQSRTRDSAARLDTIRLGAACLAAAGL